MRYRGFVAIRLACFVKVKIKRTEFVNTVIKLVLIILRSLLMSSSFGIEIKMVELITFSL